MGRGTITTARPSSRETAGPAHGSSYQHGAARGAPRWRGAGCRTGRPKRDGYRRGVSSGCGGLSDSVASRRVSRTASCRERALRTDSAPDALTAFRAHPGQRPRRASVIHHPRRTRSSTASAAADIAHSVQVHTMAGSIARPWTRDEDTSPGGTSQMSRRRDASNPPRAHQSFPERSLAVTQGVARSAATCRSDWGFSIHGVDLQRVWRIGDLGVRRPAGRQGLEHHRAERRSLPAVRSQGTIRGRCGSSAGPCEGEAARHGGVVPSRRGTEAHRGRTVRSAPGVEVVDRTSLSLRAGGFTPNGSEAWIRGSRDRGCRGRKPRDAAVAPCFETSRRGEAPRPKGGSA
jgi:hypothetical protein